MVACTDLLRMSVNSDILIQLPMSFEFKNIISFDHLLR